MIVTVMIILIIVTIKKDELNNVLNSLKDNIIEEKKHFFKNNFITEKNK